MTGLRGWNAGASFARRLALAGLAASLAAAVPAAAGIASPPGADAASLPVPVTVTDYTDPSEAIAWGQRSHWKQPWRSYLDTAPASTLLDAIGINFNVKPQYAAATARLLGDAGFKRARIEVGWGTLDYDDPGQMNKADRRSLVTTLTALRENGIRPLILLNANAGKPCPVKLDKVALTRPASAGDEELQVKRGDVAKLVAGRSGIDGANVAASTLFTSVESNGTVRLSKPLESALPAGPLTVTTLAYEPFRPARLADGSPNPANEETMRGWVNYVSVVAREVRSVLGSDEFDVEVWNELSFGSAFLNFNGYYEPDVEWTKRGSEAAILERTVEYLRDPANGFGAVGIGNGFASEAPWGNGTESLVGVSAIDKHPYAGWHSYPGDAQVNGNRPLNGLGEPSFWTDSEFHYHELFTPTYDDFFPEHFLSGVQTETLVRDLSPYPSPIQGVPHGRYTHPEGGEPPAMWITEANLGPGSGPTPRSEMSPADIRHIETKDILRYLVAYVNKGVTAIDFYAAQAGDLSLVDGGFFAAAKANAAAYPGDALGGETIESVGRLVDAMDGAGPIGSPRRLSLRALTDFEGNTQFEGNGTAAFPPLYNRDVFAFLPFQVSDDRFVIPVYVMTRNVAKIYEPSAPGAGRFDLPPEPYRLAIGGIDGQAATVSAADPLTGSSVPVEIVARGSEEIVVQLPVTDSPRLLTIQDHGCEGCEAAAPEGPAAPATEAPEPDESEPEDEPAGERAPRRTGIPKNVRAAAAMATPSLRLEGQSALLSTSTATVIAGCASDCLLHLRGQMQVRGVRYPMAIWPRGGEIGAGAEAPARLRLSIGARLARLGRRTLQQGLGVKLIVVARATQVGTGEEVGARRIVRLGG